MRREGKGEVNTSFRQYEVQQFLKGRPTDNATPTSSNGRPLDLLPFVSKWYDGEAPAKGLQLKFSLLVLVVAAVAHNHVFFERQYSRLYSEIR